MPVPFPKVIFVVHSMPGRLRLRLPWLHDHREQSEPIADRLASAPGMREVRVRPLSGSALCLFDPAQLDEKRIVALMQDATGVTTLVRPGQPLTPEAAQALRLSGDDGSRVAQVAAAFFKAVNADVLEATEGRFDLGTIASLAFASAGAAEIVVGQKMPLPPWFQLAWWAFRTFTTLEGSAIGRQTG